MTTRVQIAIIVTTPEGEKKFATNMDAQVAPFPAVVAALEELLSDVHRHYCPTPGDEPQQATD